MINNVSSESETQARCGAVSKANESSGGGGWPAYRSAAKAPGYMFSLMNIFKIPWKQLIIGCIKVYRRDGMAGLEKLLEIIGSQQAGGNNFSDALVQSGAMLAGQIGYDGIDKLSRYGAGFEKASTAAVRGWFENCPKIIAAFGYDWLDELTAIYIKVIKVNPEFGLALLNKSNDIIERAGFDMVYELSRHYELLPAGNAVLIESWIEGCFGMTARAGEGAIEKFARRTSEIFAENPSRAAAFVRGETESFSDFMIEIFDGLKLVKIKNVLSVYLEALLGAKLTIVESDAAYTDGIKIFLPSSVTDFQNREMNFTMYKVMATHEEAHIEYGSFDFELGAAAAAVYEKVSARYAISYPAEGSDIEKFCGIFPEPSMAGYIFNLFEDFRIESRLISEYPVFGTQIKMINAHFLTKRPSLDSMLCEKERVLEIILQAVLSPSENFSCSGTPARILREILPKAAALRSPSSSVQDSARLTADLYILIDEIPGEPCDQLKSLTSPLNQSVVENNIGNFKRAAREIRRRMNTPAPSSAGAGNCPESVEKSGGGGSPGAKKKLTGKDALEDNIEKLLKSLFKRRGVRPADVESAAKGMADEEFRKYIAGLRSSVAPAEEGKKGLKFFSYPEWGQDIGEYRPNLARVFERECEADKKNDFYVAACKKHRRLIKSVLREFQMLKPSAAGFVNKADSGDDLDHDPMLEYLIDRKLKKSPSEKIYVRRERNKRDIAVAILLDRSGSTAGKVLECEKESLIIMSEALASLGDDFAIYAYDGHGFECNFGIVKDFGRGYDVEVKRNIGCISPGWATAAAIRHAAFKLKGREAKTKLIMLLTDGKPTGMTADPIEDTRMALKEAKKQSIQSFCITVDGTAADYLPRMYGHSSWIVIDDVSKLPEKISKIYKRLTN